MKILLVTSQITYVPNNCLSFLDKLLETNEKDIAGVVVLQNLSADLVLKAIWLYGMGCIHFANTLIRNMFELPLMKKEKLCKKYNLPIIKSKTMNNFQIIQWVKKNKIDVIINVRTRCIYKKEILKAPRFGCVNIHHGILPIFRGTFSDLYALYENRPAGISIHQMNEKIDNGKIIYTKQISHNNEKDYMRYLSRTGKEEASLVKQLLDYMKKNDRMPKTIENNSKRVVYTQTPTPKEIKAMLKGGIIL